LLFRLLDGRWRPFKDGVVEANAVPVDFFTSGQGLADRLDAVL
jgi:hypothetical protein